MFYSELFVDFSILHIEMIHIRLTIPVWTTNNSKAHKLTSNLLHFYFSLILNNKSPFAHTLAVNNFI